MIGFLKVPLVSPLLAAAWLVAGSPTGPAIGTDGAAFGTVAVTYTVAVPQVSSSCGMCENTWWWTHFFGESCTGSGSGNGDLATPDNESAGKVESASATEGDGRSSSPTRLRTRRDEESGPACKKCVSNNTPPDLFDNYCHSAELIGPCWMSHAPCPGPEEQEAAQLLAIIRVADPVGVAQYIAGRKATARILYNVERRAIQMVDCYGTVVLHVPLTARAGVIMGVALANVTQSRISADN